MVTSTDYRISVLVSFLLTHDFTRNPNRGQCLGWVMRERSTIVSVLFVGGALLLSQAYSTMLTESLTNASLGED
jgi:hypothetical protein